MSVTTARRLKVPVVPVVCAAVLVFVLVTKPDVVTDTVTRPAALLVTGAVIGAFVVASLVLRRLRLPGWARAALLGTAAGVAVWVLLVPFYRDRTVIEAIPVTAGGSGVAASPGGSPAAAAAPERLAAGAFRGLGGHRASGEAALLRLDDGSLLVRLEGIDIQNGPDLHVYLIPGADQKAPGAAGVDLGALKGNKGSQNYPVPAGTTAGRSAPFTVLVYCDPFRVPFGNATLA